MEASQTYTPVLQYNGSHKLVNMEGFVEFEMDPGPPLGSGAYGVVKQAIDKTDGDEKVVLKMIDLNAINRKHFEYLKREVNIHVRLARVPYPLIIGFKRVVVIQHQTQDRGELVLVLQHASQGTLDDMIRSWRGDYNEVRPRYYFQQLICAVRHCHRQGIAHRDLKLENAFVHLEQLAGPGGATPTAVLKLGDFGYGKHMDWHTPPDTGLGTKQYHSPELLQASFKPATADQEAMYDAEFDAESNTLWSHAYKSDIWACGVVLYRMLFRMFPFENPQQRSDVVTMTNILRGRFAFPKTLLSRKTITREVMDLLAKMFIPNPDRRITLERIWEHPWFQQDLPQELVDDCENLPRYKPCVQSDESIDEVLHFAQHACRGS